MANSVYRRVVPLVLITTALVGRAGGQTNEVLSVNGTSAYVIIPSSSTLQPANAITVEAWLFPMVNGLHNPIFIGKSDGSTVNSQRTYELTWPGSADNPAGDGGGIQFNLFLNTVTWAEITAPVISNQWTHIAVTYASSNGLLTLYTNGVLASSTTFDASGTNSLVGQTVRQTTLPLYFGVIGDPAGQSGSGGTWAAGYMDEIRIWNTNLTDVQIGESRFCRLTGTESNLAAYWNFDGTNVNDLTGHGNNGTLTGGAVIVPVNGQDTVHNGVCGPPYFAPGSLSFSKVTGFHQTIFGPTGMTLEIETSSNLTTWSPLFILPDFNGRFDLYDTEATNQPQRFYKIVPQ